jgi:hypothetical protein
MVVNYVRVRYHFSRHSSTEHSIVRERDLIHLAQPEESH